MRGRFANSRLPTKVRSSSATSGRESISSWPSTPASGQPTMLRQTSPQAWVNESPTAFSSSSTSGMSSIERLCSWMFWRVVMSPMLRP